MRQTYMLSTVAKHKVRTKCELLLFFLLLLLRALLLSNQPHFSFMFNMEEQKAFFGTQKMS